MSDTTTDYRPGAAEILEILSEDIVTTALAVLAEDLPEGWTAKVWGDTHVVMRGPSWPAEGHMAQAHRRPGGWLVSLNDEYDKLATCNTLELAIEFYLAARRPK